MIYTNDETDRSQRQKNFYLTVYGLPISVAAALAGILYWPYAAGYIDKSDFLYGCTLPLLPATIIYGINRRHWLKMPDGTWHNIKDEPVTPKTNFHEPAQYQAEYFYTKRDQVIFLVVGLMLIGTSIWFYSKTPKSILLPISSMLFGLSAVYVGLKKLLDKTAQLKIAANGLYTKKLGFVNWDDINYAEVVEDSSGDSIQTYLEIRLKGTKFEEANQPDQRLLLSNLTNKDEIETIINQSITDYNNKKRKD